MTELEAIAARIVRTLNPADPKGAHERRYLHMSQLPDGTWRARFECGPEQGLRIKRALAAFSAPRPGKAIDADGVEHAIPDNRALGARQIDAVDDIITIALAKTGLTLPDHLPDHQPDHQHRSSDGLTDPATAGTGGTGAVGGFRRGRDPEDRDADRAQPNQLPNQPDQPPDGPPDHSLDLPDESLVEPPPGEGETVVLPSGRARW